jgi:hypothetical protein
VIIDSIHFVGYSFANWLRKDIAGAQTWVIDSIHGVSGSPCAKISGYAGTSNVNEDWLISPAMNFNDYNNEKLSFQSAYKYAGPALEAYISNDYDGAGDPNDFTWSPLTATWSAGNWVWTPSGSINISGTNGQHVYVGFKYTSTATESATWELDDIIIMGDLIIGMDENRTKNDFQVTPNPATDRCNLQFGNAVSREIRLVNLLGNTISVTNTENSSITLSLGNLASGIYFIQVTAAGSKTPSVRKLVVE